MPNKNKLLNRSVRELRRRDERPSAWPKESLVLVRDETRTRSVGRLKRGELQHLFECLADDPANWHDLCWLWEQPVQPELERSLVHRAPLLEAECADLAKEVQAARAVVLIDLPTCLVATSGGWGKLPECSVDNDVDLDELAMANQPPWWELKQRVPRVKLFQQVRTRADGRPNTRRDVLWGRPWIDFVTDRMCELVAQGVIWSDIAVDEVPGGNLRRTLDIHRDWLLTCREDLDGMMPRECLHFAKLWVRERCGANVARTILNKPMAAITPELSTFETAPFGHHELAMYHNCCRATVIHGWAWLVQQGGDWDPVLDQRKLAKAMEDFMVNWLKTPFELERSPNDVIFAERQRLPLVTRQVPDPNCDCPICEMLVSMADTERIVGFDFYHWLSEDDFAFSCTKQFETWESIQRAEQGLVEDPVALQQELAQADQVMAAVDIARFIDRGLRQRKIRSEGPLLSCSFTCNSSVDKLGSIHRTQMNLVDCDHPEYVVMAATVARLGELIRGQAASANEVRELYRAFRLYRETRTSHDGMQQVINLRLLLDDLAHSYPDFRDLIDDLRRGLVGQLPLRRSA